MKPKGASLRAIRLSQRIGLRELARTAGVSHQFLSRLEADRATASEETLRGAADGLGVPLEAIAHVEEVASQ